MVIPILSPSPAILGPGKFARYPSRMGKLGSQRQKNVKRNPGSVKWMDGIGDRWGERREKREWTEWVQLHLEGKENDEFQ